jgi:hypothetical protein
MGTVAAVNGRERDHDGDAQVTKKRARRSLGETAAGQHACREAV